MLVHQAISSRRQLTKRSVLQQAAPSPTQGLLFSRVPATFHSRQESRHLGLGLRFFDSICRSSFSDQVFKIPGNFFGVILPGDFRIFPSSTDTQWVCVPTVPASCLFSIFLISPSCSFSLSGPCALCSIRYPFGLISRHPFR